MTVTLRAACSPGEVRVAAVRDGVLIDYAVWRPGLPDGVGDLYRGRIVSCVPAMAGAFVALGGVEGFLPDTDGAAGLSEGTMLGVRVARAAQGGKGPRLSARLTTDDQARIGSGRPGLVRRGQGPLLDLATMYPDASVTVDDAALVAMLRPVLGARLTLMARAFDPDLAARVEALADPEVAMPGGSRLSIHPTPALVAIDIDAGAATAARGGKAAAQRALNLTVLPALAAEIRLRNLSGAILVDVAGMPARKRETLGPALAEALADDPLRPRLLGFTRLGLAEIVRPRVHPPLHELLAGPHAAGLAALRVAAVMIADDPARPPVLRAAPAVIAALEADGMALAALARCAGRDLVKHADPALPATAWVLDPA